MVRLIALILCLSLTPVYGASSKLFDGTAANLFSIGDTSIYAFERTDAWTAMAWIKTSNNGLTSQTIIGNIGVGTNFRGWELASHDGVGNSDALFFQIVSINATNSLAIHTTAGTIQNSIWYHVAVTYNGNEDPTGVVLYIDGAVATPTTKFDDLTGTSVNTTIPSIGGRNSTGDWPWLGVINDARIYNRALTSDEIFIAFQCMNQPLGGLIGHWLLMEDGSTQEDLSGNGATGTCSDCPTNSTDHPDTAWCVN